VDSEWIGGETLPRQPLVRCSVSSTTTRHLTSSAARPADNSSCLFATTPPPETPHTAHHTPPSAASCHADHDCCCTHPQSCCVRPKLSHHTDPIHCPAPLLAAPEPIATAQPRMPLSPPPALISPSYPSQVRLVAAACCFVPIYRGRLLLTGLSLEERGSGLFEVFETLYRSATPQSVVL
jgi:hypothetical protein